MPVTDFSMIPQEGPATFTEAVILNEILLYLLDLKEDLVGVPTDAPLKPAQSKIMEELLTIEALVNSI
jgi:hypothetical protein